MELYELTPSAIDYILANIPDDDRRLTAWEHSFILSITDQWERRRSLTDKQKETLGRIWEKID